MKRLFFIVLAGLVSVGSAACSQWPDTRIGFNTPPPGTQLAFQWDAVTGASAYQVVVALDRGLTSPVGQSGFTSATRLPFSAIAWLPGHPIDARPYFWAVRAYDRPDPTGLLLSTSAPQSITFTAEDFASPWPMPSVSPAASGTPLPTANASAAP